MAETYPISSKKPRKKKTVFHAVGVLKIDGEDIEPSGYREGIFARYPMETIQKHVPQYNIVPYSGGKKPKPLSAKHIQSYKERNKVFYPRFFMNPYQDLDYIVLQDIYANTIAGRIIDRVEELKFGNGIRPVLKLRNPKEFGNEEAQQKEIEANQQIIDDLIAVDNAIADPDDNDDPFLDSDLNTKFMALSKNASVYGRCMVVKEFQKPVSLPDGRTIKGIPNVLKVMHPRDMGIVEIDQDSWKLKSVQIRFTSQNIKTQDMIYIENGAGSPLYNALHYGFSEMQSMIGASRSLRQLIEIDFPTITKHVWAPAGFMFIKPEGTTQNEKQSELDNINSIVKVARMNNLMIDPENTRVDTVDFQPKIDELVLLADFLIRYDIAQIGIPQALFAQEKDSNRATLIGKLRFFQDGILKNKQKMFCNEIKKQWYMPNFKALYGQDSEQFKKFYIDCEFEPYKIESFQDNVDSVIKLNKEFPLKTERAGELLNIDKFENMIDPDIPRPDPNKRGFKFSDGDGKEFNME